MKLSKKDYEYLSGEEFSNGYKMKLENNELYSRLDRIIMLAEGKSVLHVGCCDHLPLIESKIEQHCWLHGLLEDACTSVVGVDINKEAVEFIKEKKLCRGGIYCADITSDDFCGKLSGEKQFDIILLGEIVEHLDNPVQFLSQMKKNMDIYGFKGQYVVTVPNALSLLRDRKLRREGIECVNSDHRFLFTPYTISKVMMQSGICPQEIFFANDGKGGYGSNRFTEKWFMYRAQKSGRPMTYKSYRSDQMIVVGI